MPDFESQFAGKVALVTGAAKGIGRGIAEVLAERGAAVFLVDSDSDAGSIAADEIRSSGGLAEFESADVTDTSALDKAVETCLRKFGYLDICVPNAGVIGAGGFESRVDHSLADWSNTWGVNVLGTVNTVEVIKPLFQDRQGGKIVIISSQGGRPPRGTGGMWKGTVQQPYLVSKTGMIQYMHHLAIELGSFSINVNAVCPGTLWTEMWEQIAANHALVNPDLAELAHREFFDRTVEASIPLQRGPTPNDVGKAVAFLASDDASEITGQALNVNGGAVMN
jgi:3-oxoacyl-[acyl-carrier protein] reductase